MIIRWTVAVLTVLVVTVPSRAASACSPSDHCYGQKRTTGAVPAGFGGGLAYIDPECLGVTPGNFATTELWVTDNVRYWVEVGFAYQDDWLNRDLPDGRTAFFADHRPGGGYHEHVLERSPAMVRTLVQTHLAAPNTWSVQVGPWTGLSVNNPMQPAGLQIGSEITADTSIHSLARADGISYWKRPTWVPGLPQPSAATVDAPNTLAWVNRWTTMWSGAPC